MVKLFVDAGIIVLTAFISPYRRDRERVRSLCTNGDFYEIHVDCPPTICAQRDQKGLYVKAQAGLIKEFTGISAPYEPPENSDLTIHSDREDPSAAAQRVVELMEKKQILRPPSEVGFRSQDREGIRLEAKGTGRQALDWSMLE